jgi:hypothetical protein
VSPAANVGANEGVWEGEKVGDNDGAVVGVVGNEEGLNVGALVATGNPIVGRFVGVRSSVGARVGKVEG